MRMIRTLAFGFSTLLVLSACGNQDKQGDQAIEQGPAFSDAEKAELEAEFSNVPAATIVRVPVDSDGNPIGEPEMRVLQNGAVPATDDAMTAAWDQSSAPEAIVSSELDADTSVQSWGSWGTGNCYYTSYNRCSYQSKFGHNYFGSYKPVLYSRGYKWNYNKRYNCLRGGYSYYSYQPNRYW